MTSDDTLHQSPRRRFSALTLAIVVLLSAMIAAGGGYWAGATRHPGAGEAAARYQCPMHPTVIQDHPGECPICGMKLVKMGTASEGERKVKFYRSPMDPRQTSPTPRKDEMGMDFVPVYEDEVDGNASAVPGLATVDIDPARQQLIGLKTVPVTRGPVRGRWRTFSRVSVDERRVRHVNIKVPVFVDKVMVNFVGKPVRQGDLLFTGYSPELLVAQGEYRIALATQKALGSSAVEGPEGVKAARRKLELLDVPAATIERLEQGGEPQRTVSFVSPISGVVTKKDVVDGMRLEAGSMPFEIVDLSTVWVLADIYESDIHRARVGMNATLTLKAYPDRTFEGVSTFFDPVLDPATRTAKLRVEFRNPTGELKPGMFGEVALASAERNGLQIPEDAVVDSGTRKVVFVALGQGKLQPREIVLGESDRSSVEVVSGLAEGEQVVVRANFLVDSESRLRASLASLGAPPASAAPSASAPPSARPVVPAPTTKPAPSSAAPSNAPHAHPHASVSASATASAPPAATPLYVCPMHPEVTDTSPSRCPKCGMRLVRKEPSK